MERQLYYFINNKCYRYLKKKSKEFTRRIYRRGSNSKKLTVLGRYFASFSRSSMDRFNLGL